MSKGLVCSIAFVSMIASTWMCAFVFDFCPDWMEIPSMITALAIFVVGMAWVAEKLTQGDE